LLKKSILILIFVCVAAGFVFIMSYRRDFSVGVPATTDGAKLFQEVCAQCHGFKGEGRVNLTPPVRGRNIPIERIKTIVRGGGQKMPPLPFIKGEALENVARFVAGMK
jgi:mono/diheme cytochrome c family protein